MRCSPAACVRTTTACRCSRPRDDREALLAAAASGDPRFFLGTDSAPHARQAKEIACGCAGIFSAHAAIELYAEAFESAGALDGSRDSPASSTARTSTVCPATPARSRCAQEWRVPASLPFGQDTLVPFRAGERIGWRLCRVGRLSAPEHPNGSRAARAALLMARRFRGFLPVVIDVETGGFNPARDALLEIAAVLIEMDAGRHAPARRDAHAITCSPSRAPPRARWRSRSSASTRIIRCGRRSRRGCAAEDLPRDPPRRERTGCKRAILVGHNAFFDLGFLNAAVTRAEVKRNPLHPFSCFDTATLAGAAFGQTVLSRALRAAGLEWDAASRTSAATMRSVRRTLLPDLQPPAEIHDVAERRAALARLGQIEARRPSSCRTAAPMT